MAYKPYEKTTWQSGDIVTAEKLNNIEGGIEDLANRIVFLNFVNDSKVVDGSFTEGYVDISAQELYDIIDGGNAVFVIRKLDSNIFVMLIGSAYKSPDSTNFGFYCSSSTFESDSAEGYPVLYGTL